MSDNNPLASLSKEQLDAVLKLLQPKPTASRVAHPSAPAQVYYKVVYEHFVSFVDSRDLESPHDAIKAADFAETNPLQAWYLDSSQKGEIADSSTSVTREEYIAWLRR